MFRIVLVLIFAFSAMASPAAAHSFDAQMYGARMAAHGDDGHHTQKHDGAIDPTSQADQNGGDSALCHCPAMICAPTATLGEETSDWRNLDYTMIERISEPNASLAGLMHAADPPPPRL